jgi:3-oxoacyl-[acyl-carrier protein] reductase
MDQEARHLVITGGGGGLGTAIAAAFRAGGWSVEAPGRQELDVSDPGSVERYFVKREPRLLVCAAGAVEDAPLARLGDEQWDRLWAVNLRGVRECARAAIPSMARRGGGHIVVFSSHSALRPPVGQVPYAAAKAALLGLVTDLAGRHGCDGVRVNGVLPGFLETAMTRSVSPARVAQVREDHALGCFNTPERTAGFIRFLEEELPHTSGQIFQLDSREHGWRI